MPELPEVETVKKVLTKLIINKKIESITINYGKILKNSDSFEFSNKLSGETFTNIRRIGKFIIFDLENYSIVSHLRMEGKYNFYQEKVDDSKHDHIIFNFNDESQLKYNDVRKFGTMELVEFQDEFSLKGIMKLGPDGNSKEFTVEYLKVRLKNKNKPIKEILLQQEIVSGIGNIYASEILFSAKIHPEKKVIALSEGDYQQIVKYTHKVLDEAISMGGTTIKSFSVSGDVSGLFQQKLDVYARSGELCHNCKMEIIKIKQGGRSTFFCPSCQDENNSN